MNRRRNAGAIAKEGGVMQKWIRALVIVALVAPAAVLAQGGPAQEVFTPKAEKGPVVVVISGQSGARNYRDVAMDMAGLGYYTVLIDGNDILTRQQDGAQNLRNVVAKAMAAPNAVPGKAMVVGFSMGGGGVLAHAVAMPELFSAAVAYYPATNWIRNLPGVVGRVRIPVLVMAAERDTYKNCCLIASMRDLETAAKAQKIPLELVVYPDADHSFNMRGASYRADDSADAWRRTREMLAKHHPLNPAK